MADPAADLVGPGYTAQVPDGAGSVAGMAQDPPTRSAASRPYLIDSVLMPKS